MKTGLVMPCLNEEALLQQTCHSLGFGEGADTGSKDRFLVLVDNGSTDRTAEIMAAIRDHSPAGLVHIAHEPIRGYVPARHAGMLAVRDQLTRRGESDAFVLQVDADTIYSGDYVDRMTHAFSVAPDCLIEGASVVHRDFRRQYPGFHRLCEAVDVAILDRVDDMDSVIVPDAICGFSLSNYFRWGGHQREYLKSGDEILAETTRLFVRARRMGCRKYKDSQALAFPSRRKVIENAGMYFSCGGFPRENQWRARWAQAHPNPPTLHDFDAPDASLRLIDLVRERRSHLIVLFLLLPAAVDAFGAGTEAPKLMRTTYDEGAGDGSTVALFERAFELIDWEQQEVEAWFLEASAAA